MKTSEYLNRYAAPLAERIGTTFAPLHLRGEKFDVPPLKRRPLDGQRDAIAAIAKCMGTGQKTVNLIGELGVGKTFCAMAAIHTYAAGKPYRTVVMCPPHISAKWVREIISTVPGARARWVEKYTDLLKLAELRCKPIAPEYWVISESTAKLGPEWKPSVVADRNGVLHCPVCDHGQTRKQGSEDVEYLTIEELARRRYYCQNEDCGSPLWSWTGGNRWPAATFIAKHMRGLFDFAVLDECFVGETQIALDNGRNIPISEIRSGDRVLSWDGKRVVAKSVRRVFKIKRAKPLVEVTHSLGKSVCTSDHKWFASGEWKSACDLSFGERLLTCHGEEESGLPAVSKLQAVRKNVFGDSKEQGEGVLLSRLLSRKHERGANNKNLRSVREGLHGLVQPTTPTSSVLLERMQGAGSLESGAAREVHGQFQEQKIDRLGEGDFQRQHAVSEFSPGCTREGVRDETRSKVQRQAGRKRKAASSESAVVGKSSFAANRSLGLDGEPEMEGRADRHSRRIGQGGDRSRRSQSRDEVAEGSRSAQRSHVGGFGVGCLPGDDDSRYGELGAGCRRDQLASVATVVSVRPVDRPDDYVYDFEVEDTHCYFANGVLVHNCHEAAGADSAIAIAASKLVQSVKHVIPLTGTYINGYAHSVMHLLWRTSPETLHSLGFNYGSTTEFARRYGRLEKTIHSKVTAASNRNSRGSAGRTTVKVLPGIMPSLFGDHILNKSVFLSLADISSDLPPLSKEVIPIEMDGEQTRAYEALSGAMGAVVKRAYEEGDMSLLVRLVQMLMGFPDHPYGYDPLGFWDDDGQFVTLAMPAALRQDIVRPKEKALLELLESEKAAGRQCWVFVEMTQKRDLQVRLESLTKKRGLSCKTLRSQSVPTKRREEWIAKNAPGVDVMFSHPGLVQTGLDLFDRDKTYNFPTLIFYQTGLKISTLRQASGRSFRLGQSEPCRVVYMHYEKTIQQRFIELMSAKLQAAEALDGKFSSEGLTAISDAGSSMGLELAKALLESLGPMGHSKQGTELKRRRRSAGSERVKS